MKQSTLYPAPAKLIIVGLSQAKAMVLAHATEGSSKENCVSSLVRNKSDMRNQGTNGILTSWS